MFKFKCKENNAIFSDYPCSYFLHNALRFLKEDRPDIAYTEICYALLHAGDKLSDDEKNTFEYIKNKAEEDYHVWKSNKK